MQSGRPDIRLIVDGFLAAAKRLVGMPPWRPDGPHGKKRLSFRITIGDEISGPTLVVKAYPNNPDLRFRLVLAMEERIWGLDFVDETEHINPLVELDGVPRGEISGPHYHTWIDNRYLAHHNSLPKKLRVARPLSPKIRRFDQAFHWFCDETKLAFEEHQLPSLPERDRLL